jgi:hypothetical protein
MKSRRSVLFQFLFGFPDMASSVGSRITARIAGDAVRLRQRVMVSCVDFPREHEEIGNQSCPEPFFVSDLAAHSAPWTRPCVRSGLCVPLRRWRKLERDGRWASWVAIDGANSTFGRRML